MYFVVQTIEKTQVETTPLYILVLFLIMCLFYMGGRIVFYTGKITNEGV